MDYLKFVKQKCLFQYIFNYIVNYTAVLSSLSEFINTVQTLHPAQQKNVI